MKPTVLTARLGVSLLLAGCQTTQVSSPPPSASTTLAPGATTLGYTGLPKDKVLWEYRMSASAMRNGDYARAKELLDDAILSMGGIIAKDKSARQSRGLFHNEAKKNFIGEPYERVMAYYYRGILYWMDGEPDNARACFRSAQLVDSDTVNKTYASDYVTLDYLDGFATAKLAGDGSDALERARKVSKRTLPDYNPKANVLVFVEAGQGPTKFAGGEYNEALMFAEGRSLARNAVIKCEDHAVDAPAYDDLYFQATTRGGRLMDQILANKATFKTTTDNIGNATIIGGAVLAGTQQGRHSSADEAGLGLLAFGVLNKLVSSATTPAADTRCWDNLPQYLSFAALELPPGQHTLSIEFRNRGGFAIPSLTKTVTINVPNDSHDVVVFVSDQSSNQKTL